MTLVTRLFVDTGPFIAYYSRRDQDHTTATTTFRKIAQGETPYRKLYASDYILDEAITLCRARTRDHKLSVQLGTDLLTSKTIVLLNVDKAVLKGSWELYKQRGDIGLSFTDSTTAVLARTHGITDLYTYDHKDFNPLGFHTISKL